MRDELKKAILNHIRNHSTVYAVLCISFVVGFMLAVMIKTPAKEEVGVYITEFMQHTQESESVFLPAFTQHIAFACIMLFSAYSAVGILCITLCIGISGFYYGTVISGLLAAYGIKSVLLMLCGILPHLLILLPCCLLFGCVCMKNSFAIFSGLFEWKKHILHPLLQGLLLTAGVSVASLIQAFAEPWLISLISSQFI